MRFPAGRVIATGGDVGGRLYVIMSGKVKAAIRRPGGCELLLAVLGSHEIFGVVSLFEPVARETRITALTEVVAVPANGAAPASSAPTPARTSTPAPVSIQRANV